MQQIDKAIKDFESTIVYSKKEDGEYLLKPLDIKECRLLLINAFKALENFIKNNSEHDPEDLLEHKLTSIREHKERLKQCNQKE